MTTTSIGEPRPNGDTPEGEYEALPYSFYIVIQYLNSLPPNWNSLNKQKAYTKVLRLALNPPNKFP